ncbi:hypothetical protein K8R78_00600 [bacterium]|nr:hypothetical protein [bacterium]
MQLQPGQTLTPSEFLDNTSPTENDKPSGWFSSQLPRLRRRGSLVAQDYSPHWLLVLPLVARKSWEETPSERTREVQLPKIPQDRCLLCGKPPVAAVEINCTHRIAGEQRKRELTVPIELPYCEACHKKHFVEGTGAVRLRSINVDEWQEYTFPGGSVAMGFSRKLNSFLLRLRLLSRESFQHLVRFNKQLVEETDSELWQVDYATLEAQWRRIYRKTAGWLWFGAVVSLGLAVLGWLTGWTRIAASIASIVAMGLTGMAMLFSHRLRHKKK